MWREQDAFEEKESQPGWLSGAAGGGEGSGVRWKAGRDQATQGLADHGKEPGFIPTAK